MYCFVIFFLERVRGQVMILLLTPHFSWPLQALQRGHIGNRWSQTWGSSKTEANQCPDRFWGYIFVFSCGTVTCPCATRCTSIYKTFHIRCSRRVRGQQGQWTGPWFVYIDVLTSIEMTPALSRLAFTFLGILSPTCSGNAAIEIRLIDEGHGIHHSELSMLILRWCGDLICT